MCFETEIARRERINAQYDAARAREDDAVLTRLLSTSAGREIVANRLNDVAAAA